MAVCYASDMRTTIDLPDELLERARQATGARTQRETVIAGLEELIRKARREELRRLAGKVPLDIDVASARRR